MKNLNKTTAGVMIEKRQWQCEQGGENEVVETNRSYAPGIAGTAREEAGFLWLNGTLRHKWTVYNVPRVCLYILQCVCGNV